MATVVSLTQAKIEELMAGWQGVSLSQGEINAIVSQLWTDTQSTGAIVENFENVTVPELLDQTNAGIVALDDLLTNQLPTLESDITANTAAVQNINTVDLPLLQERVSTNEDWIVELNELTLPELYAQLEANNVLIGDFNTTTLPALNASLLSLEDKFPIDGDDIEANAITANHILADTITANEIAADTITANEIAADTITANEIAADTITANEIAADTITAAEIAADAITANEIAADAITANEIAADAITANEIAADAITANEIAANAVTANELAANAVTAVKIAANTITGDKIAADTISATKLILSDMTNLAVDGELLDPTASTWHMAGTASLERVDIANQPAYLEATNSGYQSTLWFRNENAFGLAFQDEFHLSMEVSTPSSNTETLSLYPSIEVYDQDGVGQFWRTISTGAVALAPGTDWTVVQGTISITEANLASAKFNAYVNGIAGAMGTQKVRARRIVLRRRNGGELILDGSLNALHIDVNSLTADIMNTGVLQSGLTMTGSLTIADANMGWSKAMGLWMGNGTVFYGDERTNQIEGSLVTENISIKDGLILGGDANIHAVMELSNGVSTPSAPMVLGQTWPRKLSEGLTPTSDPNSGVSDISNFWLGIHSYDETRWFVPYNFFGAGFRLLNKSDMTFAEDLTVSPAWGKKFYSVGATLLGASFYVLGSDGNRNGDFYIYKVTSTGTITKQAEFRIGSSSVFSSKRAKLVSDGVRVGMVWCTSTGHLRLRWFNADLTGAVGTDITLGVGTRDIGGVYYGPTYSGSPNRLLVSLYGGNANMIQAWTLGGTAPNLTATRSVSDDFPRAHNASVNGIVYDSLQDRMLSMDQYAYFYTYSKYVDGGTINAQYTFYDGDNSVYPSGTIINGSDVSGQVSGPHETPASPVSTYLLAKRAWPTITAPPAQDELVTDVAKVDKANRLGIYAALSGTPRLQGYLAVGVRTLPVTDELSTSSVLANASGVPSFANSMVPRPGLLRSQKKKVDAVTPMFQVLGDGAGNWGDLSVGPDGKVSLGNDTGWTALPLASGYVQGSAGNGYTPRYRRIGDLVEIRGVVKPTSANFTAAENVTVATLPAGFRPAAYKLSLNPGNAAAVARVTVENSGLVKLYTHTAASYIALDMTFFVG